MLGGGPYEATTCPECGSTMWNGRCENPDCKYHWHPEEGQLRHRKPGTDRQCREPGNEQKPVKVR